MHYKHITGFLFLISLSLIALFGCSPGNVNNNDEAFATVDTISAPVTIKAGKPVIHRLDTCPPPNLAILSEYPPPVNRPAGFFVSMQNFNTEQGLALGTILCGFKDRDGNLWFGTSGNGVSKYDGKSFTNYNASHGLIHNLINCITEDSKGNIWFGTYGGVSKYDGRSFQNYTTTDGLPDNNVYKILEDSKNNIWMSTSGGLTRLDPNNKETGPGLFSNYSRKQGLPDDRSGDLFEDNKGNLWYVTIAGVYKYDPAEKAKSGQVFADYLQLNGFAGKALTIITGDNDGNLWFGTRQGVIRYNPDADAAGKNAFKNFTTADGLVNDFILCSTVDRDGNIWFGTRGGVSEYREKEDSFLNFTTEQGLANNIVNSITEDNSGSLWFGTSGGGLSRYDGGCMIDFTSKQGLSGNVIYSSSVDKTGNLWFGSEDSGITEYKQNQEGSKEKSFVDYTTAQGLLDNYILSMIFDKTGNLWFSNGAYGLSRFDGRSIVTYSTKQGIGDNRVECLYEDKEGNIWIGTYEGGVSKFNGTSISNYSTHQGLVHNTVWAFHEDKKGNMWIATRGGLSLFNGKSFINFTKEQGLPDNKLSIVTEDKSGNILIGSWGGGMSIIRKSIADKLSRGEALQPGEVVFENFTTTEGLANDVVYGILEDQNGNIIIGTNLGFTVLRGGLTSAGKAIAKDRIEIYNQKTGFPVKDISNNCSMVLDNNGIVWAGTGDKVVRFDYKSVHRSKAPPEVNIQNVKINNEEISWYSLQRARMKDGSLSTKQNHTAAYILDELNVFGRKLSLSERETMIKRFKKVQFDSIRKFNAIPENLVLPYSCNNISFDFVGVETTRPFLVRYQYMLKGYDKNWSPVTNNTTASFGNISGGNYTFMIRAESPDGVWSEPVTYNFEIRPPWYHSWLAYLCYVLLVIAGIFGVDRFQRRRLLLKERQRLMKRELEQAKEIEKSYLELKAAQAQLIQAEKMASLGELTAGIAHEIQNPLNFVNNFSEVSNELIDEMKEEIGKGNNEEAIVLANDVKHNLEKINHHGKRADAIVKGMLQHSRSSSGVKEPTNINALADEFLRLAYHGLRAKDKSFNASMKTDFDDTIGDISIIPQDIGRVILNLITNAFYAVNERKKLSEKGYEPTVSVITRKTNDKVEVLVKDNGNGIPKNVVDKIFQPFFTTKPTGSGTGLGLSLSYDIVKAHGGELKVETKEGEGSIFIIRLPAN